MSKTNKLPLLMPIEYLELYSLLRAAEVEMRYAGWGDKQEDNYSRYEVYNRIKEVLREE
jgi:hypothetical protein